MKANTLYIYGAGGHGRVIADSAIHAGFSDIIFADDQPKAIQVQGWPVVAAADVPAKTWGEADFIIGVGPNRIRGEIFSRLKALGGTPVSVIDPRSIVSRHAAISPGSFIAPGAIVNTGARIGANCIINTAASVDHDCELGDHCHVSPHACLNGNVHLGEAVMVGTGVIIVPGRTIGSHTIIGAGAVVVRDLPDKIRAWGVPARVVAAKE